MQIKDRRMSGEGWEERRRRGERMERESVEDEEERRPMGKYMLCSIEGVSLYLYFICPLRTGFIVRCTAVKTWLS